MKKQGDAVRVTYLRRGHEESVEVKLGSHEGGDANDRKWNFSDLLGKEGMIDLKTLISPLQIESKAVVIDKDGNLIYSDPANTLSGGAAKLEKTLRDAGADPKAIEQAKRALKEATEALQKAAGEAGKPNSELNKQIQEKLEQTMRALEEARKAGQAAKPKSEPTAPVEKQ